MWGSLDLDAWACGCGGDVGRTANPSGAVVDDPEGGPDVNLREVLL
jgi:hypothetical protein